MKINKMTLSYLKNKINGLHKPAAGDAITPRGI